MTEKVMRTVQVRLDEDLAAVDRAAKRLGTARLAFTREALWGKADAEAGRVSLARIVETVPFPCRSPANDASRLPFRE